MPGELIWFTWPVLLAIGVIVIAVVSLRPWTFWPIVIVGNMAGNGPRVYGYAFLDELVTGCAVAGALLVIATQQRFSGSVGNDRATAQGVHRVLFLSWVFYMVVLSIVGIGVTDDVRIIRWVLFYLLLALCMMVASRPQQFPFPEPRRAWRLILFGSAVAFASYLLQGAYFERVLGTDTLARWESQDYFWAGSAYAVFPIALGMPAALFLLRDSSFVDKALSWVSVGLFMTTGFYFQSRITWLVVALFAVANPRRIGLWRSVFGTASFLVLFNIAGPGDIAELQPFVDELAASSRAFSDPTDSDVTRNLQVTAALDTLAENWVTTLTGSGIYTNRYRIAPHIDRLQAIHLDQMYREHSQVVEREAAPSDTELGRTVYRTTGFGALLIDTGLIGMSLFLACFIATVVVIKRSGTKEARLMILTLTVVFLWLLVTNTADVILQYLLIMPGGLFVKMSEVRQPNEAASNRRHSSRVIPQDFRGTPLELSRRFLMSCGDQRTTSTPPR